MMRVDGDGVEVNDGGGGGGSDHSLHTAGTGIWCIFLQIFSLFTLIQRRRKGKKYIFLCGWSAQNRHQRYDAKRENVQCFVMAMVASQ